MEQQLWQEWQAQRSEMLALIRRIDKSFEQCSQPDNTNSTFLGAVEQMINSGQVVIALRQKGQPSKNDDRFIGWYDSNGFYLLPSSVRKLAMQVLGEDHVSDLASEINFHRRLYSAGVLIRSQTRFTKKVRVGKKTYNVLHIKPGVISLAAHSK